MKNLAIVISILMGVAFFSACEKESLSPVDALNGNPAFTTDRNPCDVAPVWYDGNVECSEIGTYEFTSGRIEDETRCGGTYGPITWYATEYNADGECVEITWEWTGEGTPCGVSVIMKGGSAANVYTYPEGCTSGTGLVSPVNASGNSAALSNITFCWNVCNEIVCQYETGWGGLSKGAGKAWWYYFDTQGAWTQPIYAGQQLTDGTITYDGTNITIDLGSWELNPNTTESVKAQGYNTLPTKRPAAGLFTLYKGTSLTFPGNGSRYYAIHLDLQQCE